MNGRISVIIPTIPKRAELLRKAMDSVQRQTWPAQEVCVALDSEGKGAAHTRQAALGISDPRHHWVAFLDDDDLMLANHLETLMVGAQNTGADYAFSYFVRTQGGDPLGHFGKVFDPADPHHTTMTILVRRELALDVGFINHLDANPEWPGEDWRFTLECVKRGAKIVHVPQETWVWRRHAGNTSGQPGRGDAQ